MRNVYTVKLVKAVKVDSVPNFHKESSWLYVVASSFDAAHAAVMRKYPSAEIRGIDLMNYSGVPIVLGD